MPVNPIPFENGSSSVARRWARKAAFRALNAAYHSGLYTIARGFYGGEGVIFTLHHVCEPEHPLLCPSMTISAETLDQVLGTVRTLGWELVSIDEVYRRLTEPPEASSKRSSARPFACFTCDDGYKDNLTVALPVFRKHKAPLCVYITTGIIERSAFYWWGGIEELVSRNEEIRLPAIGHEAAVTLRAGNFEEKMRAYAVLDELGHRLAESFLPVLRELFRQHGVNPSQLLERDALTISQLRELASDPSITIGAHGVTHHSLARLSEEALRDEMERGRRTLEDWLGTEIRHFSFPFGDPLACGAREFAAARRAGFKTAVTTRRGNIFPGHRDGLASLPRRSMPRSRFKLRNALFGIDTLLDNRERVQTG